MKDFDFLHSSFDSLSSTPKKVTSEKDLPKVYIVEDDQVLGRTIQKYLAKTLGFEVVYFNNPTSCIDYLENLKATESESLRPFCLVSDISFDESSLDGLLLVDLLAEKGYEFVSIVMTGFASIENAIMATKKGVFHYLTKPFELEVLSSLVIKSFVLKLGYDELSLKTMQNIAVKPQSGTQPSAPYANQFTLEKPTTDDIFCGIIGRSSLMKKVFERIEKVAASDSTIMVNGPSGTGKELVAKAIHQLSHRKDEGLVGVNCGAIPGELLESELFGHKKGSFTGAISDRKGRFELADKGTIFLDEIGDMPLLLQVKLLRVLQNREVEPVGSTKSLPIDVRIITATHRDLEKAVEASDFREDLFYRLNVIPIKIPALAQRREDIPLLISYFLSRFVSADGRNSIDFENDVLELLYTYDWPGNVRELENLIERLVILRGGNTVKVSDLPAKFLHHRPDKSLMYKSLIELPKEGLDLKKILSDIEDSLIAQALKQTNGNKNQASKLLTMNRTTLIEKMKKKGLTEISFN